MKNEINKPDAAIAKLCPACGLCCNGVLFGDVELQRGDDAKRLTKLGVELFRKGRKAAFTQPCDCLVKGLCRIYANRPKRCAAFDCGLLKRVQREELSALYAEAQAAAADICDTVEFYYRKDPDASSRRTKSARWGVVYFYEPSETPPAPPAGGGTPPNP